MKYILALIITFFTPILLADNLSKITGEYIYEKYSITLGNGRTLTFKDLGAKGADIDFNSDSTIIMRMHMLDGSVISSKANIEEVKITGNKGYWLAKWPDMNYAVRKDFSIDGNIFSYTIKFDNPDDKMRYGSVEKAVLRKVRTF